MFVTKPTFVKTFFRYKIRGIQVPLADFCLPFLF